MATTPPIERKDNEPPQYFYGIGGVVGLFIWLFHCTFSWTLRFAILGWAMYNAFRIRTYALTEYGMVIHEFDPWFNFRATQYMSKHGWTEFFQWYDYKVWYPLGRPVGTTIYPGLQITAVAIHRALKFIGTIDKRAAMSLNDVCCYVPCWFGAAATFFMFLLTYEMSGSGNAGVVAALVFSILPAHLMRSMGGGFDNESIAMTAIIMTFFFWVRSLRTRGSWPFGILTGLSYGYMVAAWGGFTFVLNLIALHAASLVVIDFVRGRYSTNLYRAYSLFFIIGTAIAVCVPIVGTSPFQSVEQLAGLAVFLVMQVLHLSEKAREKVRAKIWSLKGFQVRFTYIGAAALVMSPIVYALYQFGFFGPISSRVRALFVEHTRTGNPLVDSVAEHQKTSDDAFWHFLHYAYYGWFYGAYISVFFLRKRFAATTFILVYTGAAVYFSTRMSRLVLLCAPPASCLTGILIAAVPDWCINQFFWVPRRPSVDQQKEKQPPAAEAKDKKTRGRPTMKETWNYFWGVPAMLFHKILSKYESLRSLRMAIAVIVIAVIFSLILQVPPNKTLSPREYWREYNDHAENMAHSFSNPQIMYKAQLRNGQTIIVDDYREAYFWLRDKTPKDSRVMAWWDYGYQITGIGRRTSIADGNTWNHEHIATLGKCLTSPVKEAHTLIRHLADYVLIWAGGGGDDLAKSPHMARIGNSVYRDICPKDPLCNHFGFYSRGHSDPTPMMKASLLYHMHAHKIVSGVAMDPTYFKEVFSSRYGLVRIYKVMNVSQESKDWVADPRNRVCNPPGSWLCQGQYPPAEPIQMLLRKRRDFGQYEDFNKKNADDKYYEEYMKRMGAIG